MPVELPAVAAPIVRPLRVMVKGVLAGMPVIAVVMTMEVAVGAAEVAVIVATDVVPAILATGVAVVAKNPDGKLRVIFPLTERAENVVKPKVTAMFVLAGTRFSDTMVKTTAET